MASKDLLVLVLLLGGIVIAGVSYLVSEMQPAPGPSSSLPPTNLWATLGFAFGTCMVLGALIVEVNMK